jgi:hypothetical protein
MIIVKLIGGLGNQMFQYAAGKSLALKNHTDLYIDISHLAKDTKGAYTKRELELDVFNTKYHIATSEQIEKFRIDNQNKYTRFLQRNYPFLFSNLYVAESGNKFNSQFFKYGRNTYLDGFWQCEDYFKMHRELLLKDFTLKHALHPEEESLKQTIQNGTNISLHVRRGDYVSIPSNLNFHGVLDVEYYNKAIELIKQKTKIDKVFVFSDDIEWCKQNFTNHELFNFVDFTHKVPAYQELYLMSQCSHHIIANSSFSWWAAWLNNKPNKIVVAPKVWFADKSIDTSDIVPKQWIRL